MMHKYFYWLSIYLRFPQTLYNIRGFIATALQKDALIAKEKIRISYQYPGLLVANN